MNQDELSPHHVLTFFDLPGTFVRLARFGSGLINDTYLCEYEDNGPRKYILQRINASIFRKPRDVMENVEAVTCHIANRLRERGVPDPSAVTPALVHTRTGASHHQDPAGAFWRMFHFIETGEVFDTVRNADHAYEVGRGLGMFQSLVADLPPGRLHDTLPGFHHTPRYLDEYDRSLSDDLRGREAEVRSDAAFVDAHRGLAHVLIESIDSGSVPIRVVHNDPKVNNIMIDRATGQALCMLDLDTVKPGIVHFDFGDCVRSAANPLGEDAEDPDAVRIDLSLFEAITRGYLHEASGFLTGEEVQLLPLSVKVITFELGIRFLADYLRGDTYFKIRYPAHNLHRARVQFKLLQSIEADEQRMQAFVRTCQPGAARRQPL